MVPMFKCKPSLCIVDMEIKSSSTRLAGSSVLKVTAVWTAGQVVVTLTLPVVSPFQGSITQAPFTLLRLISLCFREIMVFNEPDYLISNC